MSGLIAVVDDEADILDLVALHLKKANFRVKSFQHSKSFIHFIKKQLPDLVVLDLMLPDADGIEVCKYLKQDTNFSSILLNPLIIASKWIILKIRKQILKFPSENLTISGNIAFSKRFWYSWESGVSNK